MRILPILLLGLLGGCRCESDPISIRFGPLEPGESRLPEQDLNTRTGTLLYPLNVQSNADHPVTLEVSLADGSTEGIRVELDENRVLLPGGRESLRVSIALPMRPGPFRADIVVSSEDLPGWSRTYELRGIKRDAPLEGRRLDVEPGGIDLGDLRAGETKPFTFRLVSNGTEAVTLEQVVLDRAPGVRLANLRGDERLEPGTDVTVQGEFRCPENAPPQAFARIEIHSNAENGPVRNFDVRGRLRRDFELVPARMPAIRTYPHQTRAYAVEVRAARDAFVVERLAGLEPYFELAEPLPTEPSKAAKIRIRLREGAPTSVEAATGTIRVYLSTGAQLEWPYRIAVLPSIHAQPRRVDFGTVEAARLTQPLEREIQIVSLPGRSFEVTARAENGLFGVRVEHRRNLPWRVLVSLPAMSRRGIYRDQILIETTDEEVPRIAVKVSAIVK